MSRAVLALLIVALGLGLYLWLVEMPAEQKRVEADTSAKKLVVPGDLAIRERMRQGGLWEIYQKAGFRLGPPGCSMCLGVASEKALPGETWLSSQNRNYPNRMGQGSLAWLASAATVAASSAEMKVADPRPLIDRIDRHRYERLLFRHPLAAPPEVRSSEPKIKLEPSRESQGVSGPSAGRTVSGRVQQFGDHVDTDAIIPGEFCHLTQLPELGARAFHHVRPQFHPRAQQGQTIVVAGEGWGSGSSREQAVWALIGAGIQAVIAKSYAFIHKRNLVNEALAYLVVEDPLFFDLAKENDELSIELGSGEVTHVPTGRVFKAQRPSPIVRALQKEGGLVPAIKKHGPRVFEALGTA